MNAIKGSRRRKTANDFIISSFKSSIALGGVQIVSLPLSRVSSFSPHFLNDLFRKEFSRLAQESLSLPHFFHGERVLRSHPCLGFSRGKIGVVVGSEIRFNDEIVPLCDAKSDKFQPATVIDLDQARRHLFSDAIVVWEQGARRYGEALRRMLLNTSGRLTVIEVVHQYRFKTFSVDLSKLTDREKSHAMESALLDFSQNYFGKLKGVAIHA